MAQGVKIENAVLVYQGGIANVFAVGNISGHPDRRNGERCIIQGAFSTCEYFARGLQAAGTEVATFWCNEAGDIANSVWNVDNLCDAPFDDHFSPVGGHHFGDERDWEAE